MSTTSDVQHLSTTQLRNLILLKKQELATEVERAKTLTAAIEASEQCAEELFQVFLPQFTDERHRDAAVAALASTSNHLEWLYLNPLPMVSAIAGGSHSRLQSIDFSGNPDMDDDAAVILAQALKYSAGAQNITDVAAGQSAIGSRGACALMEAVVHRGMSAGRPLRLNIVGCLSTGSISEVNVSRLVTQIGQFSQENFQVLL